MNGLCLPRLTLEDRRLSLAFVRRFVASVMLGYLVLAAVSRGKEAVGLITCDCYPDCWCRKPGLNLFRWVFPRFHHNRGLEAWKKQQLDQSA